MVKSTLVTRNITILGSRTSIRLEPEMWQALKEVATFEKCKIHDICSLVFLRKEQNTSLTAAIRVFLMLYYRSAASVEGHERAGHGMLYRLALEAYANLAASKNLRIEKFGEGICAQLDLVLVPQNFRAKI